MITFVMSPTDQGEEENKMTTEVPTRTFDTDIKTALYGTKSQFEPNSFAKPDRRERVEAASHTTGVVPSPLSSRPDVPIGGKEIPNVVKTLKVRR